MRCPKRGRGGIFNFLCAGGIDHFCCEVVMVSVRQQNLKGKFKPSKNLEFSCQNSFEHLHTHDRHMHGCLHALMIYIEINLNYCTFCNKVLCGCKISIKLLL